jgi:site-specific DNA-methyltransferase (adenine-specific)
MSHVEEEQFDHNLFETPEWLFDWLNNQYQFDVDAAASAGNSKCSRFFSDALAIENWRDYGSAFWLNPPYKKKNQEVRVWLKKAHEEAQKGCTVVMLLQTPNGDIAWHEHVFKKATRVIFLAGRVAFIHPVDKKPRVGNRFGSAVVIYEKDRVDLGFTILDSVRVRDVNK